MSTTVRIRRHASKLGRVIGPAILANAMLMPFTLESAQEAAAATEDRGDRYCCRKASNKKMYCCTNCYCSLSEDTCSSSDDCNIG